MPAEQYTYFSIAFIKNLKLVGKRLDPSAQHVVEARPCRTEAS
jgi:hypothetical protein